MLYLRTSSHFQKLVLNFCGTNYDLSSKTTQPLLLKSQYGFEIFQTVLSPNCKIIQPKAINLVINLSLISNKVPNLLSAVFSEINTVSNTNLILRYYKFRYSLKTVAINQKKILQFYNLSYKLVYGLLCLISYLERGNSH